MAIALVQQANGYLTTAGQYLTVNLPSAPTVGNKLVALCMTPQSSPGYAFAVDQNGNGTTWELVHTAVGQNTSQAYVTIWVGTVTSTSKIINIGFQSSAINNGAVVAELSGWTNMSAIAALTSGTSTTSGTSKTFSVIGGRDLGNGSLQLRSMNGVFYSQATLTGVTSSELSVTATPNTTIATVPATSSWIVEAQTSATSASATSLSVTTPTWQGSGSANQVAFLLGIGANLIGLSLAGNSLTTLGMPSVWSSKVRFGVAFGTSVGGKSFTLTASAASPLAVYTSVFGEKTLASNSSSQADSLTPGEGSVLTQNIYGSSSYNSGAGAYTLSGTVNSGATTFYFYGDGTNKQAGASYVEFATSSGVSRVQISSMTHLVGTNNDVWRVIVSSVPTVGGTSSWTAANFLYPNANSAFPRPQSEALSLTDSTSSQHILPAASSADSMAFNFALTSIQGKGLELTGPSTAVIDFNDVYLSATSNIPPLYGNPTVGRSFCWILDDGNANWETMGNQLVFFNSADMSYSGPHTIQGAVTFDNGDSWQISFSPNLSPSTTLQRDYDCAVVLGPSASLQDMFKAFPVAPYVTSAQDPIDGSFAPYQGGFY